jgi:hypothetical protein
MKVKWLIALLIVAVLGEFGFAYLRSPRSIFGVCMVSPTDHFGLMTSSEGTRTVKVLFVGNSLTYTNDLPGTLIKVANSDPQSLVKLVVGSSTGLNATLQQAYVDRCTLKRVRGEHFDTVVLQEHSFFWFTPSDESGAREALANWATAVRQAGSSPEYFEPWLGDFGDDPTHTIVGDMKSAAYANAEPYEVPIVRVGEAFAEAQNIQGVPWLYTPDNHHPSEAGTYLAALMFFHHFTSEPAERATWRPEGVSADQAALLAHIADEYQ